ncbi:MAG: P-loop NTPase fold protein [Thomasclavelia ramosa]
MVKPLTMIEIKTIIKNYIKDERKKQAVLLNGEWGCGKTFFIKEKLIPDLEEYQILQISLYGISSTERIQEIIYSKWIEKIIGNNTDKIGVFGNMVAKGIEIFGKSATQFVEKRLGVENTLEDIKKYFADSNLSNKQTILIFDDIERCRIEIIELMGFLNNLSENNNYKLILIANEKEITRDENINTTALKYGIALNERLDISKIKKKETDNEADKINREDLINIIKYYFGQTTTYERTREKLVGLTVPYSIPIKESFDAIINKYVKKEKDSVTKILKKNKNRIIELFESQAHKNLRTLIVSCIAIEDILSSIDKNQITKDDNMLADELDAIVVYTIYSAIRRTMGKEEYKWSIGNRYGKVNVSINEIKDSNIYGYAFVDEYWKMQCIDADIVHSDIRKRISERTEYENRLKANHNYQKLSLNKLREWYILDDDDIYSKAHLIS